MPSSAWKKTHNTHSPGRSRRPVASAAFVAVWGRGAQARRVLPAAGCACGTEVASCLFFNDTATTEIYPLSLHDALPISVADALARMGCHRLWIGSESGSQ